jgi:hypothetical protein
MVKIAVHGSYFVNNFGDTLLVKLLCDKVAEQVGRENVFLAVPGHAAEQASIGYPVVDPERRKDIDLLLYSGGGYFGESADSLYERYVAARRRHNRHLAWLDDFSNAAKAVIAVGVGPLTFNKQAVRDLFDASSAVLVRDAESLAYCRAYGFPTHNLRQCCDMALSMDIVGDENRSGVALHVPNMPREHLETIMGVLASSPAGKYAERIHVIYDAPPAGGSLAFEADLQSVAQSVFGHSLLVKPYTNTSELLAALGSYELVVTNKLHVGIVTIAQGGRVISTPHHIKTPRLYRQLGLSDYCVPLSGLTTASLSEAFEKLPQFSPNRELIGRGVDLIDSVVRQVVDGVRTRANPVRARVAM